jgi:hypothetical protein
MFDIGVNWIRIGQYENSSEPTSWDWVEQRRGVYSIAPEVDDYVDSLIENHVTIQVQLLYGNPMYTGPAGRKPDQITPEPGSFHNDDRSINSIFWAPKDARGDRGVHQIREVDGESLQGQDQALGAVERARTSAIGTTRIRKTTDACSRHSRQRCMKRTRKRK